MSAGRRILAFSAADVLCKLVPDVGPGGVFVLYGSAKMFGYFIKGPTSAIRKSNRRIVVPGHSPRGVATRQYSTL